MRDRRLAVAAVLLTAAGGCGSDISGTGEGAPPDLQLSVPGQGEPGVPTAVSYTAGGDAGLDRLEITWGDGSDPENVPLQGRRTARGTVEHVYDDPGEYDLSARLLDVEGRAAPTSGVLSIRSPPETSGRVAVDRSARFQRMTGWGFSLPSAASMELGLNPLATFPFEPGGEDRVYELLFDVEDGLGATHMAFFLGWDIEGFWSGRTRETFEDTNDDGDPFSIDPSGMDLTSDWPNVRALVRADREGARLVPKMVAPDWMKSGTDFRPGMAEEYAEHILAFVLFARDSLDLTFSHLVPHNEPNTAGTTRIDPEALVAVMRAVTERFDRRGVETRLVAPETSTLRAGLRYAEELLRDGAVRGRLAALSTHPYGSSDAASWRELAELAGREGLDVWQGEWSTAETTGGLEFGVDDGLTLARDILEQLDAGRVSAWFNLFGPVCACGDHSGTEAALVMMEPTGGGGYDVRLPARFHTVAQFSRFVRPGAVRVGAEVTGADVEAAAFESPSGDPVVVLINPGSSDLAVELGGLGSASELRRIRTSASERALPVGTVAVSGGDATVVLPGRSVTTLVAGSD